MKGSILVTLLCAVPLAIGQNTNEGPRYFPFGENRSPKHLPFDKANVDQDEANVGQEKIPKRLPFDEERSPKRHPFDEERTPKHLPIDEDNDSQQQPLDYPGSTSSRPPTTRTALRCPTLSMHGFPPSWGCI